MKNNIKYTFLLLSLVLSISCLFGQTFTRIKIQYVHDGIFTPISIDCEHFDYAFDTYREIDIYNRDIIDQFIKEIKALAKSKYPTLDVRGKMYLYTDTTISRVFCFDKSHIEIGGISYDISRNLSKIMNDAMLDYKYKIINSQNQIYRDFPGGDDSLYHYIQKQSSRLYKNTAVKDTLNLYIKGDIDEHGNMHNVAFHTRGNKKIINQHIKDILTQIFQNELKWIPIINGEQKIRKRIYHLIIIPN